MSLVVFSWNRSICGAFVSQQVTILHKSSRLLYGCASRILSILVLDGIGGTERASSMNSVIEKFKAVDSYGLGGYAFGTTRAVLLPG